MSPSPSVLTCAIGPPVGSNSAYSRSAIHTEPSAATANDDGWLFTDSWKNLNPSSEDRRPNGTKKSFCHLAGLSESSALRTSRSETTGEADGVGEERTELVGVAMLGVTTGPPRVQLAASARTAPMATPDLLKERSPPAVGRLPSDTADSSRASSSFVSPPRRTSCTDSSPAIRLCRMRHPSLR